MLKAVLFDLDDTLLANDMETFLPAYFKALRDFSVETFGKDLVPAVMGGVRSMIENTDPERAIYELFWTRFCALTGIERAQCEFAFEPFYRERFPALRSLTSAMPAARPLVEYCLRRNLAVVIATNPLFPKAGIGQRLEWAGLDPREFPFALVTTYDNMHFTKPSPGYYSEIVRVVGCSPDEAIMVGNDPEADITPARSAGLHTLLVASSSRILGGGKPAEGGLPSLVDVMRSLEAFR